MCILRRRKSWTRCVGSELQNCSTSSILIDTRRQTRKRRCFQSICMKFAYQRTNTMASDRLQSDRLCQRMSFLLYLDLRRQASILYDAKKSQWSEHFFRQRDCNIPKIRRTFRLSNTFKFTPLTNQKEGNRRPTSVQEILQHGVLYIFQLDTSGAKHGKLWRE